MIVALIILGALVAVGLLLWALDRRHQDPAERVERPEAAEPQEAESSQCCGMHITCERDSLLTSIDEPVIYYDDEELDAYAGTAPDAYTAEAVEEFREVLLTLRPADIAPWARSLQRRGIDLPAEVREELLMIVAEARESQSR